MVEYPILAMTHGGKEVEVDSLEPLISLERSLPFWLVVNPNQLPLQIGQK